MNKSIEKEGDGDDFTIFLFSHPVKEENTIKLELAPPEKNIHIGLHIFQELLQIFVDGLKYLYGNGDNEGKVEINLLSIDNIELVKKYFLSIGFKLYLDIFTPKNYVSKPDIFNDKSLIKENTMLDEYFYELTTYDKNDLEKIYRVSFKFNN
jgi:hypothetical protein